MRTATTKIPHLLYEKDLLKTPKWRMILFTICDLFTMNVYDEDWRKNPKYIQSENHGKNSLFGCLPILPSTKMEADCFPVSENTENKPDLP